jgi:uncharacterized protein involved in exopolysaccharide biosynthesis
MNLRNTHASAGAYAVRRAGGSITPILSRPLGASLLAALGAAVIVLSASTAYIVSALGEEVYGGRAEVLFARDSDAFFEGARDMETQRELLQSGVVLGPVARRTGMSVDELDEALSVEIKGESDVLRITVGDPDRETARKLAGSIATSYVSSLSVPSSTDRARAACAETSPCGGGCRSDRPSDRGRDARRADAPTAP